MYSPDIIYISRKYFHTVLVYQDVPKEQRKTASLASGFFTLTPF
jgi:hypothetical protein